MRISLSAVALAALATVAGVSAQSSASKELISLQGTWVLTSVNGQAVDGSMPELTITFTDDKYTQTLGGQVTERGTIKLDPSTKPMLIDFVITEGEDAHKTQLGVIQIGVDSITGKLNTPGAPERPTDFTPAEGALVFVMARRGKTYTLR